MADLPQGSNRPMQQQSSRSPVLSVSPERIPGRSNLTFPDPVFRPMSSSSLLSTTPVPYGSSGTHFSTLSGYNQAGPSVTHQGGSMSGIPQGPAHGSGAMLSSTMKGISGIPSITGASSGQGRPILRAPVLQQPSTSSTLLPQASKRRVGPAAGPSKIPVFASRKLTTTISTDFSADSPKGMSPASLMTSSGQKTVHWRSPVQKSPLRNRLTPRSTSATSPQVGTLTTPKPRTPTTPRPVTPTSISKLEIPVATPKRATPSVSSGSRPLFLADMNNVIYTPKSATMKLASSSSGRRSSVVAGRIGKVSITPRSASKTSKSSTLNILTPRRATKEARDVSAHKFKLSKTLFKNTQQTQRPSSKGSAPLKKKVSALVAFFENLGRENEPQVVQVRGQRDHLLQVGNRFVQRHGTNNSPAAQE